MSNKQLPFRKNKLVLAMGFALLSTTMTGCSDDDDNDETTGSTPTPSYTINASGGVGGNTNLAQGGDGGEFYVYNDGTTGGIEILQTGDVTTSFASPELPTTTDTGSNPLNITADTTLSSPIPTQYSRTTDGVGSFAVGQLYIGTDDVLRSSAAGGVANYTNDTIVTDNSFYRSTSVPNELFQAIGDDTTADLAPVGQTYRTFTSSYLYINDGDPATSDIYYTGLSVSENTTLTVSDNNGCDINLNFPNDIENNGTIIAEDNDCSFSLTTNDKYDGTGSISTAGTSTSIDAGSIYLYTSQGINNKGTIDASGYTSPDGNGGDGGEVYLSASGYIVNSGSLLANGGNGLNNAGLGNSISTSSPTYLENSGVINVDGGNSTGIDTDQGTGGNAGSSYFYADVALIIKEESTITANGGDGTSGGSGGDLGFYVYQDDAPLVNATDLTATGGEGTTLNGGSGGYIRLDIDGGELSSSGNLNVNGGNSLSSTSNGGTGGSIYFYNDDDSSTAGPGDISITGNLEAVGGNSNATGDGNGGNGGYIQITNNASTSNTITDATISFVGYDSIGINGGNGGDGGDAVSCCYNNVYIYANSQNNNGTYYAGSIVNEVPISAKGGDTVSSGSSYGSGGNGGQIYIDSDDITGLEINFTNTATIDISGGMGHDGIDQGVGGGDGGYASLYISHDLTNTGSIIANGGEGGTVGASGGGMYLESYQATTSNSANLTANGINGTTDGGHGGDIQMDGPEVSNTGDINVNAGNATDATGSFGGDGGYIGLFTYSQVFGLTNSGTFSFTAGTGETDGTEGCAQTNFINQGECGL